MKNIIKIFCLYLLIATSLCVEAADGLKVGAASVKITPPLGTPLAGYYSERGAEKIHDNLYAKAMVIESNGTKVAIVSCDLVGVPAFIVKDARNIIEKSTGIKGSHVLISATHSHTGPIISKQVKRKQETGERKPETGEGRTEAGERKTKSSSFPSPASVLPKNEEANAKYILELPRRIAESVRLANLALVPGKLSVGSGREDSISFNRRYYMKNGTVAFNPGKLNPETIRPAGPIDPEVQVLFAETLEGKPLATYVNFALHLDIVSGTDISADMPFTLSTILAKVKSETGERRTENGVLLSPVSGFRSPNEMVTMFAQGCSANINHVNVNTKVVQKGQDEAKRIGTILAGEVIKTYGRLKAPVINSIKTKSEIIYLPLPDIDPRELAPAREVISRIGKPDAPKFLEMVNAYKVIDVLNRKGEPIEAEVQVFALGDQCAIVGLPGELFTELGLYIKSRSPYQHTLVVELANGSIGYVADRKAYSEGSYEPTNSKCAPGSGEMLAQKALQLLYELKSE